MRTVCSLVATVALLGTYLAAFAQSDDIYVYEKTFKIASRELGFRIDMDGGELRVEPNDQADECLIYMRYNKDGFTSEVNFNPKRSELEVVLDRHGLSLWKDDGSGHHMWSEVVISLPTVPKIDFYAKIKAGEVDMELGGLRLLDFELRNWAGDITVDFDEPNPVQMEYFEVDVKAGELKLRHLGNANFEEADINGGIGDLTLDFRGNAIEKALARIDLDVGETKVILPEDLGVKLKVTKFLFLSRVDLPVQFKRQGRYYYTENYQTATRNLYLRVSPGIGEFIVDID